MLTGVTKEIFCWSQRDTEANQNSFVLSKWQDTIMKNIFLLGNFVAHIGDVKAIKFKSSTGCNRFT